MRIVALLLALSATSAAANGYPAGVTLTFSQSGEIRNGKLTLEATLHSNAKRDVVVPSEFLPWSGSCSFDQFYMAVFVRGFGNRLPYQVYRPTCYPGPPITIRRGQSIVRKIEFSAPVLMMADPKHDVIEFVWIERVDSGSGLSGVLEIR